jgi:hypothetical protein
MQRPSLTVSAAAILASGATLLLAVAPALGPITPATPVALRVVELPRVVITGTREARASGRVELSRVGVGARGPARLATAAGTLQPALQRRGT